MKKGKGKDGAEALFESEKETYQLLVNQLYDKTGSYAVSSQIQDEILQNIAQKMWEKDLLKTYKSKYTSHYGMMYGSSLFPNKFDQRGDDRVLTPKRQQNIEEKQFQILKEIRNKKREKTNDSFMTEEDDNDRSKVDEFPNQDINPITKYPQANYEENEAVSLI